MSRGEYIQGLLLLAVPLGASALAAWAIAWRRLAHLDGLERLLAGALVGMTTFAAVHLVPLVLGVLSQASVIAASVVAAAAALALARRAAGAAVPEPPRAPAAASGLASRVVAGAGALLVAGALVSDVRDSYGRVIGCVDTLSFHLPNVARWMESGSLWQYDQFLPLQAQGAYPNTGDLFLLGVLLPFHDDVAARWPMLVLFALFAVAIVAVGRELGAPPATRVAAAAALCSVPILVRATIECAMPDVVLLCGLTIGGLFLLRHARTGRTSDLVLGGIGLGLAFGTKWYGVPAAVLVWVVVLGARAAAGAGAARVAREGGGLAGVVALVGGVWLLRNLVEVDNPVFPVDLPLFDAPRDVVREQVGFSILHYLTDLDVLLGDIPREIEQGAGLLPAVLAAAALAVLAVVVARRGARDGRVLALLVLTGLLTLAYVATPYTALGLEGDPVEANFNTRYGVPAMLAATATVFRALRAAPGWAALAAEVGLVLAVAWALPDAFPPYDGTAVATSVALAVLGAVAVVAWRAAPARARSAPALAAAALVVLAAGAAYGWRTETSQESPRYVEGDRALAALDVADRRPGSLHVAIAGDWNAKGTSPVWPAYGRQITNEVTVIGSDEDGFLTNHRDRASFLAALREVAPDALIVGRGLDPQPGVEPPQERWALSAGWIRVATSDRLVLLAPPA